jgi:CDP-diacylglycerol--glycerol-3-phosphate 3-phosphatidyltransferase
MTWTSAFGRGCGWLLRRIVHGLALTRISPNALTFFGLVINIGAAVLFGLGGPDNQARMFRWAGATIIGAGIFDMVDGRVARATGQVTQFGAFFDSVIDRYSDLALFFGLLVYYARAGRFFYIVLVAVVMTGSVMVSYTRARAESLIGSCKVGFMERPERVVLVILGALFNVMAPVLWVIAVLSNVTVVHRILYTYQQTRKVDEALREVPAALSETKKTAEPYPTHAAG